MNPRQGYKQTEVGMIPKDWRVVAVGECLKIRHGKSQHEVVCENGEYPILATGGEIGRAFRPLYSKPSVLIGRKGTIDVPRYVESPFWSVDTLFYSEVDEHASPKFMFYQFCMVNWYSYNEASGVPSLNAKTIEHIQIPFPPTKDEQEAIANVLSDVDALLAAQDKLIAKKRDIKQAAMQQLLTGKQRLPGFSGEWEVKRLGNIALFYKGKGLAKSELDPYGSEPCIHYGELFTRHPETISKILSRTNTTDSVFRSVTNDVLMPTSDVTPNGLARASCVQQAGIVLGGDILVIRANPKELNGSFLSYVIRQLREQVMQLVSGTTVFHLYGSDMKKFEFAMPSVAEQQAIVKILDDMDADLAALEQQRDKTRALKQGMMQELLTGRIQLV